MVENGLHLFDGDAGEPLDKLSDLGAIFQILKESGDRDPFPAGGEFQFLFLIMTVMT